LTAATATTEIDLLIIGALFEVLYRGMFRGMYRKVR